MENKQTKKRQRGFTPLDVAPRAAGRLTGFTLMEVLFSLVIFVVAVLTSLYVLTEAHKMSQLSRERLLALNAARSTLEMIKNTPLGNINDAGFLDQGNPNTQDQVDVNLPTMPDGPDADLNPDSILDNGDIELVWDLNLNPDNAQILPITIQVTWTNRTRPQTFEITTVKSRF